MKDIRERCEERFLSIKKENIPQFPVNMLLEVTNICNHSCIFCANSKMTRGGGYIKPDLAERILEEAHIAGTREVGFYATGEPLVNPDLERYIQKAKSLGYTYIYITTNGALLSEQRMRTIVSAGVDSIKFSINAGTENSYEMVHGKRDFNKVLNNLRNLNNFRKGTKGQFKIYVSTILTRYTMGEDKILYDKIKDYVDDHIVLNCRNQGGGMFEINKLLSIKAKNEFCTSKINCTLPFNKLHITYEGYLNVCCVDFQNYLAVEDLNTCSLKEAWESKRFQELREKHRDQKLEGTLCYNCLYNKCEHILPLNDKYAREIALNKYDKSQEIIERLERFGVLLN